MITGLIDRGIEGSSPQSSPQHGGAEDKLVLHASVDAPSRDLDLGVSDTLESRLKAITSEADELDAEMNSPMSAAIMVPSVGFPMTSAPVSSRWPVATNPGRNARPSPFDVALQNIQRLPHAAAQTRADADRAAAVRAAEVPLPASIGSLSRALSKPPRPACTRTSGQKNDTSANKKHVAATVPPT